MVQTTSARDIALDLQYAPANDGAGFALTGAVYADDALLRQQIGEDAKAAGLRLGEVTPLSALGDGEIHVLPDVIAIDCPDADLATIAALARLDMRAARSGARLVVSTNMNALDAVFGSLNLCNPAILVDATRGERVIALMAAMRDKPNMRVRELSSDDRLALMRLTDQVAEIARRLEDFPQRGADGVFRFRSPSNGFKGEDGTQGGRLRASRPPLPDPRLVRAIIARRQKRGEHFDSALFADPAWDMLLDLTAARAEHRRVSVTSLCIASGVPATTALRWISQLVEAGLFERVEDESDRRRAFIGLTDRAADAMARYFAELGGDVG